MSNLAIVNRCAQEIMDWTTDEVVWHDTHFKIATRESNVTEEFFRPDLRYADAAIVRSKVIATYPCKTGFHWKQPIFTYKIAGQGFEVESSDRCVDSFKANEVMCEALLSYWEACEDVDSKS